MKGKTSDINNMLDALYLELLNLVEQQTACKINIEHTTNAGHLLLAKTRYNQGSHTISMVHIPTANSEEFNALCQVVEKPNVGRISSNEKVLLRHNVDKEKGYLEPMNWFTMLPSISLRNAAEKYKKSLEFVIESVNIQTEMLAIIQSIEHLKSIKQKH